MQTGLAWKKTTHLAKNMRISRPQAKNKAKNKTIIVVLLKEYIDNIAPAGILLYPYIDILSHPQ